MLKYNLELLQGCSVSFQCAEYDKENNKLIFWVNGIIVASFDTRHYKMKFWFKGKYSDTYFFKLESVN